MWALLGDTPGDGEGSETVTTPDLLTKYLQQLLDPDSSSRVR